VTLKLKMKSLLLMRLIEKIEQIKESENNEKM